MRKAGAFGDSSTRRRLYHVAWRSAGVRAGRRSQELGNGKMMEHGIDDVQISSK